MRYVSILFLCLVFAPSSFATIYYVSLSGNNANDGSSGRPWRTLQYAATKVPAGQGHTIKLGAGTFVESQILLPMGVNILGEARDLTIIKSNPSFYFYPASPGFSNEKFLIRLYSGSSSAGNQSIKNLTVDGDGKKLHGGIFINNRNNVVIENVKVQYVNFNAIWFSGSHNGTVKNIQLKDCAWGSTSWCSAALAFANSSNLDISGFDIDEGRGYGIKNLGHDQNAPLTNVKLHHGKVSVHQTGMWNGGSAPNISIELWASAFPGTEISNTYIDNHISLVNPSGTRSSVPLKIYNNVFDILGPRTKGSGYCIELSANDVEIRNNWFYGGAYGVVNWAPRIFNNWNIHHNVFYGISGGANPTSIVCSYKGGVQGLNLYNNTVELTGTSQAVHFLELDNGSRGTNVNLKNNLILNSTAANKVINLRANSSISGLNVTNNFFQNITQGTAPGNYSANSTGTAGILRSGNKPHSYYNHIAGGNLIDKGAYVGFESVADIGACGDNNVVGIGGSSSTPPPPPPSTPILVTGVSIAPLALTIGVNATSTLTKNIVPSNATNQAVTWSSSNAAIARIDAASGVVTGVAPGSVTITIRTAEGNKTATSTVTVNSTPPPAGGGSVNGLLTRAAWTGISGDFLTGLKSSPNYPNNPNSIGTVSTFAGPANWADNYGSKIYGYIRPQTTGSYTFWITGDNNCELYLSPNQNAASKTMIATVLSYSGPTEVNKHPQQKSAPQTLTAGQYYYVEALHKDGLGPEHVTVYWQGPGIAQSIIGSAYISTTLGAGGGGGSPETGSTVLAEEEPADQFVVYPVPVEQGADFTVLLPTASKEVKVIDMNGREHRSVPVSSQDKLSISSQGLVTGIYYLQVIHSRGSEFKKVLVK